MVHEHSSIVSTDLLGELYWVNKDASFSGGKLSLPVAATVFPREIYRAPKSWTEQEGHFAAFEEPDTLVEEMRSAFRKLR